ncbi:hypothetical protein [Ureibacillus thermosphaericus]|uniref:ABC-type Fe3+-hydroxamate transport system substrate-binding protein n=1 Tax=Ureibacillus thermosphaericus TaxID=51173 RepID=A0A840PPS7_URETH|nr:hypothetical protein [Ureibacillus thermosphaericus]MBB5148489.1 ABC-type Fe3+-hydroxamate transport system substrate-binding protein [Ureibacillus thermosphaericus]NKZ30983.1 hypothetical protein [Ureibacillus thermosphaericus]
MKKILSFMLFLSLFLLAACGDKTEENLSGDVDSTDTETAEGTEDQTDNREQEINEVIVDNENVKATLVKIVKIQDETWGNSVEVVFDITNKRDHSIEVQARSVSVDDRMIDETILSMSQEVAPGKSATAKLTIQEFEGYEFPQFEKNLEMTLYFFSWDNVDYEEEHPVSVTF